MDIEINKKNYFAKITLTDIYTRKKKVIKVAKELALSIQKYEDAYTSCYKEKDFYDVWKIIKIVEAESNKKQFKQFNPELFKKYLGKLSTEDKLKMLEVMFRDEDLTLVEIDSEPIFTESDYTSTKYSLLFRKPTKELVFTIDYKQPFKGG